MTNTSAILKVEGLSLEFVNSGKSTKVLDDVSFELAEGEILGIVGESGSGKSVTALSIMQLLSSKAKITHGNILYCGADRCINLVDAEEETLCSIRGKDITMIFQEPMSSLNPSHTCGKQVLECVQIHNDLSVNDAEIRVKDIFRQVELSDINRIYNSYPHQLSGGQLQRVMIAMALINNPKIIIADEPTTALDVTVQKSILQLLSKISKEYQSSILFISHDLGVIRELCSSVVVMQEGKVVEIGKVEDIFNKPFHPYTQGLIACRPPFDRRMIRLPMVSDFLVGKDSQAYIASLSQSSQQYQSNLDRLNNGAMTLLKVEGLNKKYAKRKSFFGNVTEWFHAVNNVSFELREGEILGLVGESGCGKSTLGRSLLRLIEPDEGNIIFQGCDVRKIEGEELRKLRKDFQIIFQDPFSSLNPRMKIGDAIREPMDIHNILDTKQQRVEKTMELLELVGLKADHVHRYPHQFSGGQRQRICIARTLTMQPKFIVCDESVSALDVSVQAQVLNLLLDLKDKFQLSYLFISHNIGVIKFFCDNVMVMRQGEIVERGDVESVIHNPQHLYTQTLIQAVPK